MRARLLALSELRTIHLFPVQLAMLLCALVGSGCGWSPDAGGYGSVTYPTKNSSINGLGVFEQLCKQAGSRCIVANRLSSRLEKVDTIVLVGSTLHPPAKEARDWLEEWLAGESGRCVVYFGRDFDANIYYRQQTLDQVPPAARQRATMDLALAQTRLDTLLFNEISDDVFCRWFTLRTHQPRREITQFRGPWAGALAGTDASWPVRVLLEPPDPADAANKPKWPPAAATATNLNPLAAPQTKPSEDEESVVFTSRWGEWDIGDDETWESEWEKAPEPELLLSGSDGTPLITRLTSERYPGSHILTIVNGAPLLNGTLVEPHFRKIAHKIIDDLQPSKRIALLPYTEYGILVSLLDEEDDDIAGLSVLTTWPMNIIMAHLAFLGILICLALFPILGRPQKLRPHALADFGQHAESLGQLLQRTGDLNFALEAVADYHRTVRGEAVPGWVESALQQTTSAPRAAPQAAAGPTSGSTSTPTGGSTGAPASGPTLDPRAGAPTVPPAGKPMTASHILSRPASGSNSDSPP